MLTLTPYPRASSGSKSSRPGRIGNALSKSGAEELARRIQEHWNGYPVGVRLEPVPKLDGDNIGWCVRSDLVNGLPPR